MDFLHSIKFKFTVWYLLILALLLVGLGIGVHTYLADSLWHSLDNSLRLRSDQLRNGREMIESISQGRFEEKLDEAVVFYYERDGQVHAVSRRDVGIVLDEALVRASLGGQTGFVTIRVDRVGDMRFLIVPFRSDRPAPLPPDPGQPLPAPGQPGPQVTVRSGALAVGRPIEDIEQALAGLKRALTLAIPLTLLVAGAGGLFLARRVLRPVQHIADTARNIGETDLSRRIAVNTRDELGQLAATLNQMIERLEKAFNRQREFTGDASHELRTPLAVIQAESTLALQRARSVKEYQASLASIAEEADHMGRIIDQLLALARADSGSDQASFQELDLNEPVREVAADMDILSRDRSLQLELLLGDPVLVRGDHGLLRQLLLNLVGNAMRYTPPGGKISIVTAAVNGRARLAVSDTGQGIPAEHLPHIFDRFYRADKARSRSEGGSGLGLAICKQVAELHGGEIEVESRVGQGSTFTFSLPLVH
jgi:heavy metal sensor kinase